MKIISWDIEGSGLDADFATVLCVGWKELGKARIHVPSILDYNKYCTCCQHVIDPSNDKALLQAIYPILSDADAWVTWFGKGYDVKFVNTRLLYHHLPPLPPVPHIDGYWIARTKLKLHSNRLASVQSFLELPEEKTKLSGPHWNRAKGGDPKALKYIIDHCKKDVAVLEMAYERLKSFCSTHPNHRLMDDIHLGSISPTAGCPVCGHPFLRSKGIYVGQSRAYQRLQCKKCGAWSKRVKNVGRSTIMNI